MSEYLCTTTDPAAHPTSSAVRPCPYVSHCYHRTSDGSQRINDCPQLQAEVSRRLELGANLLEEKMEHIAINGRPPPKRVWSEDEIP
jgi:hypothetical protein